MESLQGLKSRLGAVKNVGQITKAMEVVAATKMRKAQEQALRSRPYAFAALNLLERIGRDTKIENPLLLERPVKTTLVVILASDRGLAGSFNSQIFRSVDQFLTDDRYQDAGEHSYCIMPVGKKAITYAAKSGHPVVTGFENFGDITLPDEVSPISAEISRGYLSGKWDRVVVFYTNFRSALKQEASRRVIFPVNVEEIRKTLKDIVPESGRYSEAGTPESSNEKETDYILEPGPTQLAKAIIPHLIKMQFYHVFLEAKASEHSARRLAMKTASDNAEELSHGLQLEYNKLRQTKITGELMEITGTLTTLS